MKWQEHGVRAENDGAPTATTDAKHARTVSNEEMMF